MSNGLDEVRKRLLIVTAGFGAGHNVVAATIAESVRTRWPQVEVRIADLLTLAPAAVATPLLRSFLLGVTCLPRVYGWVYGRLNRRRRSGLSCAERLQPALRSPLLYRTLAAAREFRPDLIIHTHWLAIAGVARELQRQGRSVPQSVVVTDVIPHRVWYLPAIDHYFLPATESREPFDAWSVERDAVTIGGFPVRSAWEEPIELERVRAEWSIPADKPVVVLSCGTLFTSRTVERFARRIVRTCPESILFVLCGRNRSLQRRIERLSAAGESVVAVPFTDRIPGLVKAASAFVTKAGGGTVMECVAAGVPLVLLPIPGQETENADWLAKHEAAVVARNHDDAAREVRRLLDQPSAIDALRARMRALYHPGRETVLRYIGQRLGIGDRS